MTVDDRAAEVEQMGIDVEKDAFPDSAPLTPRSRPFVLDTKRVEGVVALADDHPREYAAAIRAYAAEIRCHQELNGERAYAPDTEMHWVQLAARDYLRRQTKEKA